MLPNRLSGVYRPSEIIPFQLDKEAAIQAFKSNLKGKRLLPKYFKQDSTLGDFTGIYVPFWLFDCDISGNASYRAKMVSTWSDSHYQYTKTDHYQLRRAGNATYVHIPVDGSKKLDDAMMDAIEPFDYTGFKPFEMSYLSGYLADRFDVDAQTCSPRAENRARSSLQQNLISSTSGYGLCTPEHEYSWISRKEAKYTLLPVWTLNATYKNKKYRFAMNGQTGKLIGELPVSAGKGAAWFFGIFGGIAAVSAAIAAIAGGVFG